MGKLNVYEVLDILKKYYITESEQMVTRWIREDKIKATRTDNRKEGWEINESDLYAFIDNLRPGLQQTYQENEILKEENKKLSEISNNVGFEIEQQQLSIEDLDNQHNQVKYGKIDYFLLEKVFFASEELAYISKNEQDHKFKSFYNLFFDNDKLKPEIFDPDQNVYMCPITYRTFDYPKPLIKNAVKEFLKPRLF